MRDGRRMGFGGLGCSWFSNFGQLRRNTGRFNDQRLAQVDLAVSCILTVKLIKWADRWSLHP